MQPDLLTASISTGYFPTRIADERPGNSNLNIPWFTSAFLKPPSSSAKVAPFEKFVPATSNSIVAGFESLLNATITEVVAVLRA
jgi:hypothetical protein